MRLESSHLVSLSTDSPLNETCDLVSAPAGGVGVNGARQLSGDGREE